MIDFISLSLKALTRTNNINQRGANFTKKKSWNPGWSPNGLFYQSRNHQLLFRISFR